MLFELLVPLLGLVGNIFVNFLCRRFVKTLSMVESFFVGFFAGLALMLVCQIIFFPISDIESMCRSVTNVVVYLSAAYVFFHFVHIAEASVRIRILRELSANGPMLLEDIIKRYGAEQILQSRLDRLIKGNQIFERNQRYFTGSPKMLYVARAFAFLKRLLLGEVAR